MVRRQQGRASTGRAPRAVRAEVAVSRLEQHHVDALAGGPVRDAAMALLERRASGEGFGLVAVADGTPAGVLGVRFGEQRWELDGLVVDAAAEGLRIDERLVAAAEELARPLGSVTGLDGSVVALG